jgi:hypothetical protein
MLMCRRLPARNLLRHSRLERKGATLSKAAVVRAAPAAVALPAAPPVSVRK